MTSHRSPVSQSARPSGRLTVAVLTSWVPAAALVVLRLRWQRRLPDRLASHWSGPGVPDGYSGTWSWWWVCLAVGLAAGVLVLAAAVANWRRTPTEPASAVADSSTARWRAVIGPAVLVSALIATAWCIGAAATLAAGSPERARLGWRLALIAAPFAYAGLVWPLLGRRTSAGRTVAGAGSPSTELRLGAGEQAAWSQSLHSTIFLVLATGLAVAAIATGSAGLAGTAIPLAVATVIVASLASIRVTVDARGLRVCVLGRVPVKRIRVRQVHRATTEHIDPTRWGGWGYRVMPGRSALVLRAGPGLVVDITDGRRFAVTLPDPDTPAALLNALRARVPA